MIRLEPPATCCCELPGGRRALLRSIAAVAASVLWAGTARGQGAGSAASRQGAGSATTGQGAGSAAGGPGAGAAVAQASQTARAVPATDRRRFAERAAEMRRRAIERGDQPYGAIVVRAGQVIGEGVSAVVTDRDPTAHAEMQAIRAAARALGTSDLSGCELYGTSRACPMCEAGAYRAGISRMYHGEAATDAGAPRLR